MAKNERELDETYRVLLDVWKREISVPNILKIDSMERFIPRSKSLLQYLYDKLHHTENRVFKDVINEFINRVKFLMEDIFECRFKKIIKYTQENLPLDEEILFPFEKECYRSISLGFKGYIMAKNFVLNHEHKQLNQFIKSDDNLLNNIQDSINEIERYSFTDEDEGETIEFDESDESAESDESNSPIADSQGGFSDSDGSDMSTPNIDEFIEDSQDFEMSQAQEPDFHSVDELNTVPEIPDFIEQQSLDSATEVDSADTTINDKKISDFIEELPEESKELSKETASEKAEAAVASPEITATKDSKKAKKIKPNFDKGIEYSIIRVTADVPELVGEDFRIYGPFFPNDIVYLPKSNADIVIFQQKAEKVEPII